MGHTVCGYIVMGIIKPFKNDMYDIHKTHSMILLWYEGQHIDFSIFVLGILKLKTTYSQSWVHIKVLLTWNKGY